MPEMKILVLDGANKNTLAIVRHLGRLKSGKIDVVSYQKASVSFFSRYASKRIILPNPVRDEKKYFEGLIKLLQSTTYDLLIPVGYRSFQICADHQDEIKKLTTLIIPSAEAMEIAASKVRTQEVAEAIGIPAPKTYVIKDISEVDTLKVEYPAVIKASLELGKSIVEYAQNQSELKEKYLKVCKTYASENALPIIQEYIVGQGAGFFAYYENGLCKRIFMHRRLREYPATGGASVCAEGFYNEKLKDQGIRLLNHLKWNGVAMVEFKMNNKSGEYVLMEINPKFWGSLDLSLVSGIVFPYFMVMSARGDQIEANFEFNSTKRFQWILNGELYHFIQKPGSIFKIMSDLFRSKNDIWLRDLLPNLFQLMMVPIDLYKKRRK